MKIYTTSQARTNLFGILEYTAQSHDPVYVVGKHNKAVILAEEDYRAIIETLYISSIPGLKESILKSRDEPLESCTEDIDWDEL